MVSHGSVPTAHVHAKAGRTAVAGVDPTAVAVGAVGLSTLAHHHQRLPVLPVGRVHVAGHLEMLGGLVQPALAVGDGPGGAGDAAADRFGNAGMKAMDIADAVANVLKEN